MVLWRPKRPSRTNTWESYPFNHRGLECKVRSHEIAGITDNIGPGVQNEIGQRLIDFCQENVLVIASTLFQQHKRRLYTWTSPDGQQRNQIDYILCSQGWKSSIQSAKTRPGADYGSDYELTIAKFRLTLKKVGETTRPFRYDLNQIPYNYTVEVTNRFKGWDLVECLKKYMQRFVTLYRRQWPKLYQKKKKKCKKANGLTEDLLREKEIWKAKEKGKGIPNWMLSSRE